MYMRTCRKCGCTDDRACRGADGPCYWVADDLCSECLVHDDELTVQPEKSHYPIPPPNIVIGIPSLTKTNYMNQKTSFLVTSTLLLKSLQQINGVISSNPVLPIIEDFLFEVKEDILTLTATDLETIMQVKIGVNDAKGEASICIPAKFLLDYLKSIPEQPLLFIIHEKESSLEITSDVGNCRMGGEKAAGFPKEPAADNTTSFELPSVLLLECINNTLFAANTDVNKPAMTGVLFEIIDRTLSFVSTDANRLAKHSLGAMGEEVKDCRFVVPKKSLANLKAILPVDNTQLHLSYNEFHLFIRSERINISCRLIDQIFPNYKAVIPTDNPHLLTIHRGDFLSTLHRVGIFASSTSHKISLNIKGNTVQLSAEDADYSREAKEIMGCVYDGDDMKINFNAKLIQEIIRNLGGNEIEMKLKTDQRAVLFQRKDKEENVELLMLLTPLI